MLPGLSTGGGGFSGSSAATSGADGGTAGSQGDSFATLGNTNVDTSLFSNTGISFGNKGINPTYLLIAGVAIAYLMFKK